MDRKPVKGFRNFFRLGGNVLNVTLLWLMSCSAAPKRPAQTVTVRNIAESRLGLANKEADQGKYENALNILKEVRGLAVRVDDPRLLIREGLSRGNILYTLGREGEAAEVWNRALAEAESAGEQELAGAVRIYMARSALLAGGSAAAGVRERVSREIAAMKEEKLFIAFGWIVIGLAEKERGRWTEGEDAIRRALGIHEKHRYLEQAAYDWYLIASIRSLAGRYDAALEALRKAVAFDRRSENTYGLGTDWRALGDVHKKAGSQAEALAAYRRAIDIFRSLGLEQEASAVEARLDNVY
jgi:tetratricopeptide (TPR) repeat protein